MEPDQRNLDIKQLLGVLRRRAALIILCCLSVGGAAFAFSRHQPEKYTATASLLFNNSELSQQVAGLPVVVNGNQQPVQNTNVKLVQLGETAAKTASRLGRGLTAAQVRRDLSVTGQGDTNVVNVTATSTSPALATAIANTYTDQFVIEQQHGSQSYFRAALALVRKQLAALSPQERAGPAGLALQNREQSLGILSQLQSRNVQIAQKASVPKSPSSPKVSRNTAVGAVLGLALGLALAFLIERLDRRIREPGDFEAIYRLPLLGIVPQSSVLAGKAPGGGDAAEVLPPVEAEAFRMIRARLRYFNVDREVRTVLVISAAPGDGKTTVARHLAGAVTTMGSRGLLMEVDLRRPTLAAQLGIESGPGLSDVLIGAISFDEAIQPIVVGLPTSDGGAGHHLDVLVAGSMPPPNPGELVESHAMEAVLEGAKDLYDLIVIDTPALTAVSDAFPLLSRADGVIIVGRIGQNRRDVAERLHETLREARAPLLGVVANGYKVRGRAPYVLPYDYPRKGASLPSPASAGRRSRGEVARSPRT